MINIISNKLHMEILYSDLINKEIFQPHQHKYTFIEHTTDALDNHNNARLAILFNNQNITFIQQMLNKQLICLVYNSNSDTDCTNYYNVINFYHIDELFELVDTIIQLNIYLPNLSQHQICLIANCSGKIDYGGIAVNLKKLHHILTPNITIQLGNCQHEEIECNDSASKYYHTNQESVNQIIAKHHLDNNNTIFILLSYLTPSILDLINAIAYKVIFFVPGIFVDILNQPYHKIAKNNINYFLHSNTFRTINKVKEFYLQSKLCQDIYKEQFNKIPPYFHLNSLGLDLDMNLNYHKIYDIGFVVSDFNRPIKNCKFALEILHLFPLHKKLLIGLNLPEHNLKNVTYFKQVSNEDCQKLIAQTKLMINTSFFDAGPTTLLEALNGQTLYLTTSNCGFCELLPKNCILDTNLVDITDKFIWIDRIQQLLNNPPIINNINSLYPTKFSLYKIIESKHNDFLILQSKFKQSDKIDSVYIDKNVSLFGNSLAENYQLKIQTEPPKNMNCIYFGLSDPTILSANKGFKIVIFTGTDIKTNYNKFDFSQLSNIVFISISPFISKLLSTNSLVKFIELPIIGSSIKKMLKLKPITNRKDYIYIYTNLTETYNTKLLVEIYQRLQSTDVKFIICTNSKAYRIIKQNNIKNPFYPERLQTFNQKQLFHFVYQQCFIGLRLTDHDGCSNTVCELGCLGIKAIHNGSQPNAIKYETIDDIIESILYEYDHRFDDYTDIANLTREYITKANHVPWQHENYHRF